MGSLKTNPTRKTTTSIVIAIAIRVMLHARVNATDAQVVLITDILSQMAET